MKKNNLIIVIILILVLTLSACTSKNNRNDKLIDEGNQVENQTDGDAANSDDETVSKMPSFILKDINGVEVSSDIFKDFDMTIISIWQST